MRFKLDDRKKNLTQKVTELKIRLLRQIVQDTIIKQFNTGTKEHLFRGIHSDKASGPDQTEL